MEPVFSAQIEVVAEVILDDLICEHRRSSADEKEETRAPTLTVGTSSPTKGAGHQDTKAQKKIGVFVSLWLNFVFVPVWLISRPPEENSGCRFFVRVEKITFLTNISLRL